MPLRHTSSSSSYRHTRRERLLPWLSCARVKKRLTTLFLLLLRGQRRLSTTTAKEKKCRNCKKFRQFIAAKSCPDGGRTAECRFGAANPYFRLKNASLFLPQKYVCLIFKPLTRSPTTTRNPTLRKIRAPTFPTKFTKCYGKRDFLRVCGTHRRR